ncbi:YjaG family protein [Plectonema radiosum NIES-515]|uniref:YjaG family protein n=1 Tax=Plectonema radiosum NIES-515 TaxID=2986073 RepID=A0ABT3B6X6_9CYAN|nr:YjaG family protein [Plectonema radiosum]MCV3217130.1 YjaG family protein [Plectonema radiosum NIES-515]
MNLYFFDIDSLEQELKQLPPFHRVAFAASICERMLPNYNAFSQMENWGDPSVPRKALDAIWQALQRKSADEIQILQLAEDCVRENVCPDSDDFFDSYYLLEAQEALFAIHAILHAYLNPTSMKFIVQVVKGARFNTIELFIRARDKSFNANQYRDKKERLEAISNHLLAKREISKENEDLQLLKEVDHLKYNSLESLRTSNSGRSLIDVN